MDTANPRANAKRGVRRQRMNRKTNTKKVKLNLTDSIIALNVNIINTPIK